MAETPTRTIGILWYTREDYPRIRAMMTDPHNLAPSYDQWLMAAENNEQVARTAGLMVLRVAIAPNEFAAWCAERDLEADGKARARLAQETVARLQKRP